MIKKKLTRSDYFIIAANLLPIPGVLFLGWDPNEIFLVYCLETIIIGFFNLVKMGIVTVVRKTDTWYSQGGRTQQSGLFFMLFFLAHYGIFVGVQMALFFGVSGIGKGYHINAFNFFFKWPSLLSSDALIMLGVFVFSYAVKMINDFILTKAYRDISLMKLMFQPYARIFIQQVVVILGSIFLGFGAGTIFIIIFALVKIYFEVFIDYEGLLDKGMNDIEGQSGKK